MKIITSNAPASGDNHGCPFKHFGRDNLQTMLTSYRLSPDGVKEVMDTLSAGPHYQIACTKFFECSRGMQ